VATRKSLHDDEEEELSWTDIPGLKDPMPALLSNPDSWFSGRTYHIRGDAWTEFVKDANKQNFTSKDFWQKWIKGLSETYKWEPNKPIEFCPSAPDFDYVAAAIWDRYIFLAATRVAMAGLAPKDDAAIQTLQAEVEISKEKALESVRCKVDWAINTAKVDALCLQEAGSVVPPAHWLCFPAAGASTVVWVAKDKVEEELTKEAEKILSHLKDAFHQAGKAWAQVQQNVKTEVKEVVDRTLHGGLHQLEIPLALKTFLEDLIESTFKGLDDALEENLNVSQEAKQFKKIQRWFNEDKIAVVVAQLNGAPKLILSAHGESGGHTSRQVLLLAKSLHEQMLQNTPELGIIVGMDANVKTSNTGAAASPDSLLEIAQQLGFSYCSSKGSKFLKYAGSNGEAAKHTVSKTRSFLQPQLKGKAGVPDENMKDYIFYCPSAEKKCVRKLQGRVINQVTENDPEGLYVMGGMPRGLDFPSDHALLIVESEVGLTKAFTS